MKLEDIGFYTLSDDRVRNVSSTSPIMRCEIVLTDRCNFKCPYCKGMKYKGDLNAAKIMAFLSMLDEKYGIENIRFTGGEPTLHPDLDLLVSTVRHLLHSNKRIAISSNGYAPIYKYWKLINEGVNDFSISLDACCSSFGKEMCGGIEGAWERVIDNIKKIATECYTTLGMVFTEDTVNTLPEVVMYGHKLGVTDIRIISSAQYNRVLDNAKLISKEVLDAHPILKYRVTNILTGRKLRGLSEGDNPECPLVIDDIAVAGNYHFPCIIYLREGGKPIGTLDWNNLGNIRSERIKWFMNHNSFKDPICRENCLDVCIDYNNRFKELHHGEFS